MAVRHTLLSLLTSMTKSKRKRIFHVNMLKSSDVQSPTTLSRETEGCVQIHQCGMRSKQ